MAAQAGWHSTWHPVEQRPIPWAFWKPSEWLLTAPRIPSLQCPLKSGSTHLCSLPSRDTHRPGQPTPSLCSPERYLRLPTSWALFKVLALLNAHFLLQVPKTPSAGVVQWPQSVIFCCYWPWAFICMPLFSTNISFLGTKTAFYTSLCPSQNVACCLALQIFAALKTPWGGKVNCCPLGKHGAFNWIMDNITYMANGMRFFNKKMKNYIRHNPQK